MGAAGTIHLHTIELFFASSRAADGYLCPGILQGQDMPDTGTGVKYEVTWVYLDSHIVIGINIQCLK